MGMCVLAMVYIICQHLSQSSIYQTLLETHI